VSEDKPLDAAGIADRLQKIREMISQPAPPMSGELALAALNWLAVSTQDAEGKWLISISLTRNGDGSGLCHYIEATKV
jgi:hypothetical protein